MKKRLPEGRRTVTGMRFTNEEFASIEIKKTKDLFDKTKVKVFPLVKKTFMVLFKEFFDEDFD